MNYTGDSSDSDNSIFEATCSSSFESSSDVGLEQHVIATPTKSHGRKRKVSSFREYNIQDDPSDSNSTTCTSDNETVESPKKQDLSSNNSEPVRRWSSWQIQKLELYNNTDLQYSPDPPSPVFSSECSSSSGSESDELEPGSEDNTDCSESMEDLSAIYPGSSITIENFDALLLAFSQKHHLPEAAIDNLLKKI